MRSFALVLLLGAGQAYAGMDEAKAFLDAEIKDMSTLDRAYNPLAYHNGTVWPHDNSLIAWGLRRYGYGIAPSGHHDPPTDAVVRAFQRHFRPARVDGRADRSQVFLRDFSEEVTDVVSAGKW